MLISHIYRRNIGMCAFVRPSVSVYNEDVQRRIFYLKNVKQILKFKNVWGLSSLSTLSAILYRRFLKSFDRIFSKLCLMILQILKMCNDIVLIRIKDCQYLRVLKIYKDFMYIWLWFDFCHGSFSEPIHQIIFGINQTIIRIKMSIVFIFDWKI